MAGQQLKEAQAINKSLSALGDVIASLQSKNGHVPYRNSKLTQVGGLPLVLLCCCRWCYCAAAAGATVRLPLVLLCCCYCCCCWRCYCGL